MVQVWWKALPEVALPDELLKRFAGKGMAIVGYEACHSLHQSFRYWELLTAHYTAVLAIQTTTLTARIK